MLEERQWIEQILWWVLLLQRPAEQIEVVDHDSHAGDAFRPFRGKGWQRNRCGQGRKSLQCRSSIDRTLLI
jgi:hypothetical protein